MTSRTYLNADGTYTAQVYLRPIHYKTQNGSWQPIDTRLAVSSKTGFGVENTANVFKTYLPAQSSGWVRVESGNASISFRPLNTTDAALFASGSGSRGSAWADTTLSYEIRPGALKETITLSGPGAPASFSFALALGGLTAALNKDNSISLADQTGGRLSVAAPWMKDATGRVSGNISVSLSETRNGLVYTIAPDPAWLATAQYPVVVDPTVYAPSWTATAVQSAPNTLYSPGYVLTSGYDALGNPATVPNLYCLQ